MKIYLTEIAGLADHFRDGKDELFPSELVTLYNALDALPKAHALLLALRAICEEHIDEFNMPDLNELLESFSN